MVRTFFALGCLMLCLGLFSCYDENGTYGSDLVDSAFRNVRIDTSTVGSDLGIDRLVGDIR